MNEPIGRFGSCSPARARRTALATAIERFVLADHALRQTLLHPSQLLHLAFEHLRDRNAGPFRDHFGDVFFVDLFLQVPRPSEFGQLRLLGVELFLELGIRPYWISAALP